MVAWEELTEGMVLLRPAVSAQGQMLAPAGTRITGRHLRLFKMWGVTEADVEGQDEEVKVVSPLSEVERRVIEQTVAQRFEGVLGHPVMMEIARVAIQLAMVRERENA